MYFQPLQRGRPIRLSVAGILVRSWVNVAVALLFLCAIADANSQALTPNNVYMNAFHVPWEGGVLQPDSQAAALSVLTNGVVNHGGDGPLVDNVDTWASDDLGVINDFVGFSYDESHRFDSITIELGNQFGDGGDWEAMPNFYVLKNPALIGATVEPDLSANWVEVSGATETSGHVFDPIVVPGAGGTIQLDLTGIPAADRTGWGWAVGGVDGNQNESDIYHFISLTEAYAEGTPAELPDFSPPSTPEPVQVVANSYNSVARSGDGLVGWRGQYFASVTNGVLDRDEGIDLGADGFDTFEGDAGGTLTDFVGLQYSAIYEFDSITVELGNQFGDGGDWEEEPRIYMLKNAVDTNTTRPEEDPANWVEITGAVETTGHTFDPMVVPGEGGTINFDLTGIPAEQRRGWGWAVGGVDGNQNADGVVNFISVTELDATGSLIPGPYELQLEVNTTSGEVKIINDTPAFDLDLDYYQVTSADGSLSTGDWNSLQDQDLADFPAGDGSGNGWEELGNLDSTIVAEAYLNDSSLLMQGNDLSLGNLFSGPAQDLAFRYRTAGGQFINGDVTYIGGPGGLAGDFNNDGVVDAADYVAWRDGLGGEFSAGDYQTWKANFGNMTSGAAAQAPVPEPGTAVLLLGLAATVLMYRPSAP